MSDVSEGSTFLTSTKVQSDDVALLRKTIFFGGTGGSQFKREMKGEASEDDTKQRHAVQLLLQCNVFM